MRYLFRWRFGWEEPPSDAEERLVSYAIRLGINAAALWLAAQWVRGIEIEGWPSLLALAAIFGVVNTFVKPVVLALSCPAILLTLGLFTLLVNAAMLALAAWLAGLFDVEVEIDGFWAAVLGALLISVVSLLLSVLVRRPLMRALR